MNNEEQKLDAPATPEPPRICQTCKPEPNKTIGLTPDGKCPVCKRQVTPSKDVVQTQQLPNTTEALKVLTNEQIEEAKHPVVEASKHVVNRDENGKFLPGVSGNPNGRPKRDWTWKEVLEDIAMQYVKKKDGTLSQKRYREVLAQRLFTLGIGGNVQAINSLMNRMDGMPQQDIVSDGQKIQTPMLYTPAEDPAK